uniref:Uncharacterized protein n=1 Tax=Lepeophtheirus salmonis TaxID=72036 RepID=A0A0K2TGC7_LEPSM
MCTRQYRSRNKTKNFKLIDGNSLILDNPKYICEEIHKFYSKLYSYYDCQNDKKCSRCTANTASFFEKLKAEPYDQFKISEVDKDKTETHLSFSEIEDAILKNSKRNKSPGPSGFYIRKDLVTL